jgi:hypothetical protein
MRSEGAAVARKVASGTLGALLLGSSLWWRIDHLGSLPEVDGDEAWHAIQLTRMMRGESFSVRTEHGLPLSPFHAALELPLLLAAPRPSLWILRVPTVITGVLAVVLAYVLGARWLDRTTALIASALMAVLPVAVIAARTGYESSHAPLFSLLLIDLAARRKPRALVALLVASYFCVHPTMIFLVPALAALILARPRAGATGDPARERRRRVAEVAALTAVAVALGIYTLRRPIMVKITTLYQIGPRGRHDPVGFLALFGRLLLGIGTTPRPRPERLFWIVAAGTLVLGTARLVRERRWERLALVVGVLGSVAGFFAVGGSDIIRPGSTRYGLFLVAPAALAFACLVRSLLIAPACGWRAAARPLQLGALLALGWALLLSCPPERIGAGRVLDAPRGLAEKARRPEARDPRQRALALILADIDRDGAGRKTKSVVIVWDWMTCRVLEYLALPRRDVVVFTFTRKGVSLERHVRFLRDQLLSGAYVVDAPGEPLDGLVTALFPPPLQRRWTLDRGGVACLTVARLKEGLGAAGMATRPPRVEAKRD